MGFTRFVCKNEDETAASETSGEDVRFMIEALKEADNASESGEVPVGAVIVKDGEIIARAHNMVESSKRSYAHAEMLAMEEAEKKLGAKWLSDTTMYVTLEPCSMCAGAMVLARVSRLVTGASDPKTGACGSVLNVAANPALNHRIEITRGVLADECGEKLREFFRNKRGKQNGIAEDQKACAARPADNLTSDSASADSASADSALADSASAGSLVSHTQ